MTSAPFYWENRSIQKETPLLPIFRSLHPVHWWLWQGSAPRLGSGSPSLPPSLLDFPASGPIFGPSCLWLHTSMLQCFPSLKNPPLAPDVSASFTAELLRHLLSHRLPRSTMNYSPAPSSRSCSRRSPEQRWSDQQLPPYRQVQGHYFPYLASAELASLRTLLRASWYLPRSLLVPFASFSAWLSYQILECLQIKTWTFFPFSTRWPHPFQWLLNICVLVPPVHTCPVCSTLVSLTAFLIMDISRHPSPKLACSVLHFSSQ